MKKSSLFLQIVIVLIGIVTLAVMIRLPLTEGRAVNLDLFSIYADPFILYGYLASVTFFVALYQAFRLLGYVRHNEVFSESSVKALRIIKRCAIVLGTLIVMAGLYIRMFNAEGDDPAGFLALCIMATFISVVVATAASMFERIVESRKDLVKLRRKLLDASGDEMIKLFFHYCDGIIEMKEKGELSEEEVGHDLVALFHNKEIDSHPGLKGVFDVVAEMEIPRTMSYKQRIDEWDARVADRIKEEEWGEFLGAYSQAEKLLKKHC